MVSVTIEFTDAREAAASDEGQGGGRRGGGTWWRFKNWGRAIRLLCLGKSSAKSPDDVDADEDDNSNEGLVPPLSNEVAVEEGVYDCKMRLAPFLKIPLTLIRLLLLLLLLFKF